MRLLNIPFTYFFLLTGSISIIGCSSLPKGGSKAILTIDDSPVSTEEFIYVFKKNNFNQKNESVTREDLRNYLDLFINFKLKVREAEALGLHQDSSFVRELEGYRKQLAQPYLTETRLLDSLVQVSYERMKQEVSASHLLVTVSPEAGAADTVAAYNKIMGLRDRILAGADFNTMATQFSEDPSAAHNQGNLGYFTALQMVYPFEETAYNLPVGSVSKPVRTKFGYHLIKVNDKRPSQGRIQVAHILIRANESLGESDSLVAADKAWEIYQRAKNDEDWNLLCRHFSEDTSTKMSGGSLPWFKTGDVSNLPTFEQAAFSLPEVGAISEPVKTTYGWHIIRLQDRQGLEPLPDLEGRIKSNLLRNSRGDLNRQALVERLKKENGFLEYPSARDQAFAYANDSLDLGLWEPHPEWGIYQKELFKVNQRSYSVQEFYQFIQEQQPLKRGSDPVQKMALVYQTFLENSLIQYEEEHLAEKHDDYKMLLQEYRDGILLFQLMEDKVWNRAIRDEAGLNQYFDQNRQRYQWEPRVEASIFNAADQETLSEVTHFLDKGYFEYLKYDFSGSSGGLNKAQLNILDNMAQQLIQGEDRYLVLQHSSADANGQIVDRNITDRLANYEITESRVRRSPAEEDFQGFLVYVASEAGQDLADKMNKKNPLSLQFESGRYQRGDHPQVDQVPWNEGKSIMEIDGRYFTVIIEKVLPTSYQELDEIKGKVISDYQTKLEQDWTAELRNKYQVIINEKAVDDVYEQISN